MGPTITTQRSPRRTIHCIAQCQNCGWNDDNRFNAARLASNHVRQTGHAVTVEQGVTYTVKPD